MKLWTSPVGRKFLNYGDRGPITLQKIRYFRGVILRTCKVLLLFTIVAISYSCGERKNGSDLNQSTGAAPDGLHSLEEGPTIGYASRDEIFDIPSDNFGFFDVQMETAKRNIYSALEEAMGLAKSIGTFSYAGGKVTDIKLEKLVLTQKSKESVGAFAYAGIELIGLGGAAKPTMVGVGMDAKFSYYIDGEISRTTKSLHLPMTFSAIKSGQIKFDAAIDLVSLAKQGKLALARIVAKALEQRKKRANLLLNSGELSGDDEPDDLTDEISPDIGAKAGFEKYENESFPASFSVRLSEPGEGFAGGTQLAYDILVDILGQACVQYFKEKGVIANNSPCRYKNMPSDSLNYNVLSIRIKS